MRAKEKRAVVTFFTTAEAMATEKACRRGALEGKLISAPRNLTADCGLAWSAPEGLAGETEALLVREKIEFDSIYHMEL